MNNTEILVKSQRLKCVHISENKPALFLKSRKERTLPVSSWEVFPSGIRA